MTRHLAAPTFTAATSRKDGRVHLSEDGSYTLCRWIIRPYWQRHDGRVTLFTIRLSGVEVCSQCARLAQKAAA